MRHSYSVEKKLRVNDFDEQKALTLANALDAIMHDLLEFEQHSTSRINRIHRAYEISARNLLHYLALLRHDLFPIRKMLSLFGLSSLGRSESHVLASLSAVLRLLNQLLEHPVRMHVPYTRQVTYEQGFSLLEAHTESLFGPAPAKRRVRIMVTFSSEMAHDHALVRRLLERGMDCARINCAHDEPAVWKLMCQHVRTAERETGRRCRILMDLAGPKLRTGPMAQGVQVCKIRPRRNALGALQKPAMVYLTDSSDPSCPEGAVRLPVADHWHKRLKLGDEVAFHDARGKARRLTIKGKCGVGFLAFSPATAYLTPQTVLRIYRNARLLPSAGNVGALPYADEAIIVRPGDSLILSAARKSGCPERRSPDGRIIEPAAIACTFPEIFSDIKAGERICFDDGKIVGLVESASAAEIRVTVANAKTLGSKLLADKGINLPDSNLSISGLTAKDVSDLEVIGRCADMVALSFVRSPADVSDLHRQLSRLGCSHLGVVLKIETRQAVKRLPSLLLSAMATHPIGVMIARGDLAVELGFDNLAQAQEEILLACEAAHVPVIWATQVLENLAKYGMPSRAEISDAAMGVRAECVMLNKGAFIESAVAMLEGILQSMECRSLDKVDFRRERRGASCFMEGLNDGIE